MFILFYFLGGCRKDLENFNNLTIAEEEAACKDIYNSCKNKLHKYINIEEEYNRRYINTEEEDRYYPTTEEEYKKLSHILEEEEKEKIKYVVSGKYANLEEEEVEKESNTETNTGTNTETKVCSETTSNTGTTSTTVPSGTGGPININIAYNSQNSINELDNNEIKDTPVSNKPKDYTGISNNNPVIDIPLNKNLGAINYNDRINTNADWIYGKQAWTNEPDYYLPEEYIKQTYRKGVNELSKAKKYRKNNDVCPLMVNVPWTEYKSGDSEPEPYNL